MLSNSKGHSNRLTWTTKNFGFVVLVKDVEILTKKHPSAVTKPASQYLGQKKFHSRFLNEFLYYLQKKKTIAHDLIKLNLFHVIS